MIVASQQLKLLSTSFIRASVHKPFSINVSDKDHILPKRHWVREILKQDINWYPGHIAKGIKEMNKKMRHVDCVIEVHDARIPFIGRTKLLSDFGQVRPTILILNKIDLAEPFNQHKVKNELMIPKSGLESPVDVFFGQLQSPEKQKKLFSALIRTITNSFGSTLDKTQGILLMVAGLPNVGKSTFINALRGFSNVNISTTKTHSKVKAAAVGRNAGVTRTVGEKICVWRDPTIYIYDSPGVLDSGAGWSENMDQSIALETVLQLGACGCMDFDVVNLEVFCDYLLYWFNSNGRYDYVSHLKLPRPTDNVIELLQWICKEEGFVYKTNPRRVSHDDDISPGSYQPDLNRAARYFLYMFHKGSFGTYLFHSRDPTSQSNFFPFTLAKSRSSK